MSPKGILQITKELIDSLQERDQITSDQVTELVSESLDRELSKKEIVSLRNKLQTECGAGRLARVGKRGKYMIYEKVGEKKVPKPTPMSSPELDSLAIGSAIIGLIDDLQHRVKISDEREQKLILTIKSLNEEKCNLEKHVVKLQERILELNRGKEVKTINLHQLQSELYGRTKETK